MSIRYGHVSCPHGGHASDSGCAACASEAGAALAREVFGPPRPASGEALSDRETAERILRDCRAGHTGPRTHIDEPRAIDAIAKALTSARRESPAQGLVDPRLIEAAQTDATVNAALKYHRNGAPLVEALTAAVLDLAAWKKLWSPEATKAVMMQPPPAIVVHGAPGLVEAARRLIKRVRFGQRGLDGWTVVMTDDVDAIRAALPKETP